MFRLTTIKTIASTLTIAVTLGFLVQYGESEPAVGDADATAAYNKAPRSLMLARNAQGQSVFGVPNVVTTPLDHAQSLRHVVAVDAVYTELDVPALGDVMTIPLAGCQTTLTARRQPAAMVSLAVSAPCSGNKDFVVTHSGLRIAAKTDGAGNTLLSLPALVPLADYAVSFDNVLEATTQVFVPELRQYDRAVLGWATRENMRLHALERGARIGDPGHVWSGSLHTAEDTRAGRNGFVVNLGNADAEIPYQAEVYTFPKDLMSREGNVDLQVGITVSAQNCGREVDAQTIQTNAGATLVATDIAIQMPSCGQIGQVLLLSNKFTDLTVASN